MKKTLIALAALASVSAFAQSSVTISGKFGTAYQKAAAGKANLAVTDGDVNFASVEDLGGGMKAGATIGLRTRGRENTSSATVAAQSAAASTSLATAATATAQTYAKTAYSEVGRDATVYVSGDFGKVTAGSIELGNGITGLGWGGANVTLPTDINNGGVLSANAYANVLIYSLPSFNGVNVSLIRADSIGSVGLAAANVAASGAETDRGLTANVVAATYSTGALSLAADYTKFGTLKSDGGAYDGKRTRISASYDLGMAKVGFGQEDNSGTSRDTANGKQTTAGVSVPMGALTLGAVWAKNTESTSTNYNPRAYGLVAEYALSKRTALNFSYSKKTADNDTATTDGKQYRARLMHSF